MRCRNESKLYNYETDLSIKMQWNQKYDFLLLLKWTLNKFAFRPVWSTSLKSYSLINPLLFGKIHHMSEFYIPTASEQLILPRSGLIKVTHSFAKRVRSLMQREGIVYSDSKSRTKSEKRMVAKINARGGRPLADIHGILFVMDEDSFDPAFDSLRQEYPTPDLFPSGMKTKRDRRDPEIRRSINSASDDRFRPLIFNLLIPKGARIAEVQLMTPETYQIGRETRARYVWVQQYLRGRKLEQST